MAEPRAHVTGTDAGSVHRGENGPPIALQLWTVRAEARGDLPGTLERVARLGFDGVELVDTLLGEDRTGTATRAVLDRVGLAPAGYHAFLDGLESDLDGVIARATALGCSDVVCAWLEEPRRADEAAYVDVGHSLAEIGERCRDAGLQLVYHHHDFEYVRFGGRSALDLLCEMVGPELMTVELDTYWVLAGGADPVAELARWGPRCELVHVKDRLPEGAQAVAAPEPGVAHRNTEVGTGVLDLPALLDAGAANVRWYIVEQDVCPDGPLASAATGLGNLRRVSAGRC